MNANFRHFRTKSQTPQNHEIGLRVISLKIRIRIWVCLWNVWILHAQVLSAQLRGLEMCFKNYGWYIDTAFLVCWGRHQIVQNTDHCDSAVLSIILSLLQKMTKSPPKLLSKQQSRPWAAAVRTANRALLGISQALFIESAFFKEVALHSWGVEGFTIFPLFIVFPVLCSILCLDRRVPLCSLLWYRIMYSSVGLPLCRPELPNMAV